MMSEELKACPFCAAMPSAYEGHYCSSVKCDNGHAIHVYAKTLGGAIAAWNTRPISPSPSDEVVEALKTAKAALKAIAQFGSPWEISDEPEEFGGTDDGLETVCMAYENMQGIAERALTRLRSSKEGDTPSAAEVA